jgi:hypothetical protein
VAGYREALHVSRIVGEIRLQAVVLDHLGDTYLATDDPVAARDAWNQALAILDDLRDPSAGQLRAKIRDGER